LDLFGRRRFPASGSGGAESGSVALCASRSSAAVRWVFYNGAYYRAVLLRSSAQSQPLGKRTLDSDVSRLSAGRVVETEPGTAVRLSLRLWLAGPLASPVSLVIVKSVCSLAAAPAARTETRQSLRNRRLFCCCVASMADIAARHSLLGWCHIRALVNSPRGAGTVPARAAEPPGEHYGLRTWLERGADRCVARFGRGVYTMSSCL
jgi:hypothetical protein